QRFEEHFQYYADIARWIQRETERALRYLFAAYAERAPSTNVAYAGGLALNAVANAALHREAPFDAFYFQPAAGDNGLAIGCCYYGWVEVLGRERVRHDGRTAFGRRYSATEVDEALAERSDELLVPRPAG